MPKVLDEIVLSQIELELLNSNPSTQKIDSISREILIKETILEGLKKTKKDLQNAICQKEREILLHRNITVPDGAKILRVKNEDNSYSLKVLEV